VVRALDRKVLRDLRAHAGQAVAIAVLLACAVTTLVGSVATARALERSQARYYAEHRFAHVFAAARRAPEGIAARIAALPGVAEVETRVASSATVERPAGGPPASARILSLPPGGARVNVPYLRAGSGLDPDRTDQVLVSEGFALANQLRPGDRLGVVVNGKRQVLRIAGVALSPEFVYAIRPGDLFPDDRAYGILWTSRAGLAAAADLEGAFDEVAVLLAPGAREADVIAGIDRLLAPYGGLGAHGRDRNVSHRFLSDELAQLRAMAALVPAIFLGVAAFVVSVVLSRLVTTQRQQIGALEALGYGARAIALHYAKLVSIIALAGGALGAIGGIALGRAFARSYADFYRLPVLAFEGEAGVVVAAVLVALAAALAGSLGAVRRAVRIMPAEAMRPEPPASYRPTLLERAGLFRPLSPAARMIARDVARRPARALLSAAGLACAVAILVVAWFAADAMDLILEQQLVVAQRQDLTVTFTDAVAPAAALELRSLPGVRAVEGFRAVPVTLRRGHRSYRTALTGVDPGADLTRLVAADGRVVPLPPAGLVLSAKLGELLHAAPGDRVEIEVLEGRRRTGPLTVALLVDDLLGVQATLSRRALADFLGEGDLLSGAQLSVDPAALDAVQARLRERPRVAGTTARAASVAAFRSLVAGFILAYMSALGALGAVIAAGVVYNAARVTWAERARELATLRVLGFTRAEIWRVLAGEIGVYAALGIPAGCALGLGFVGWTAARASTDLYRIPAEISAATFVRAALLILAATAAVLLAATRWVRRADLLEVLKSKE
jgi:putative ABC transport system permease protein